MKTEKEVENYAKHKESVRGSIKKTVAESKEKGLKSVENIDDPHTHSLAEHELDDDFHKKVGVNERGGHWGYHLLCSAGECNKRVDDKESITSFLKELVKALKMKPLTEPIVVHVNDKEEGRGTSAFQMITTSHISFHGDDQAWSAYIDVFSCAPYDPQVALKLIQKYFEPKKLGKFWMYRDAGVWPRRDKK